MYAKFKRADEADKVCFVNPLHVCGVQEMEYEFEVAGEPYPLTYLVTTIATLGGSYIVEETPEEVVETLETCVALLDEEPDKTVDPPAFERLSEGG